MQRSHLVGQERCAGTHCSTFSTILVETFQEDCACVCVDGVLRTAIDAFARAVQA
ncbi:hypothetical protein BDW02DRAFT_564127 [Decorospora gaudefroyi]|uniref:Uncharacterized protein n=1 Tax=Decorospora gaudefroyi TaxID=184978 RepID=A0A6A5KSG0_9PLEO|nr:hypothetical protein BDW02DRAFT_564127 [Decorospora gaudefroyi]